jgi:hypothetical protein
MKIRKLLLVIVTISSLNSCFVYNSQFSPPVLIESKNDIQINAGYWYNGVMPGGYGKYDEAYNPAGNFAIGLIYHFNLNHLFKSKD